MTRRSKSKPPKIICGVNCWDHGCSCSPPEVLEANQKMWAERFAELNRNKRRNVRRREQRHKNGYVPCRYCGIPLHFEETQKSKSGKHIPLQENNLPHSCSANPNNTYFRSLNKNAAAKAISKQAIQKISDFEIISDLQDQVDFANSRLAAHTLELKVKEKRKEGCIADLFWPPDDNFAVRTEHKTSSNSEEI